MSSKYSGTKKKYSLLCELIFHWSIKGLFHFKTIPIQRVDKNFEISLQEIYNMLQSPWKKLFIGFESSLMSLISLTEKTGSRKKLRLQSQPWILWWSIESLLMSKLNIRQMIWEVPENHFMTPITWHEGASQISEKRVL